MKTLLSFTRENMPVIQTIIAIPVIPAQAGIHFTHFLPTSPSLLTPKPPHITTLFTDSSY